MQVTSDSLIARYSDMETEELLELHNSSELTDVAETAIHTILAKRELSDEQRKEFEIGSQGELKPVLLDQEREISWNLEYKDNFEHLEPEQKIAAMLASNISTEQILAELLDMGIDQAVAEQWVTEISGKRNEIEATNRANIYRQTTLISGIICFLSLIIDRVLDSSELFRVSLIILMISGFTTAIFALLWDKELKKNKLILEKSKSDRGDRGVSIIETEPS